jgi:hypothetical protein
MKHFYFENKLYTFSKRKIFEKDSDSNEFAIDEVIFLLKI